MKNYNAEKISLTIFCMFDLGSYWPASDNFAGGILKALLAANF